MGRPPGRPGPGLMEKLQDAGRSWPVRDYEAFSHNQFCLQTLELEPGIHCLELRQSGADRGQLTTVWAWGRSGARMSPLGSIGETGDHIRGEVEEGRSFPG